MGRLRRDDGNTSVLTIGFMVVILMIIGFGTALTAVELDRNRLQLVADGAALAGAGTVSDSAADYGAASGAPRVSTRSAETAAREFVAGHPELSGRLSRVTITDVRVDPDGTVHVDLRAVTSPPLIGWVSSALNRPVTISVSSSSRAF